MSRQKEEFKHRTSVFEGAYRAWSHLGGLDPEALETRPATDLDPVDFPLENDDRRKDSNLGRRVFPYEPLPRSGLAHPFVKLILTKWLGPNEKHEAVKSGLGTLRTWWQHRRKGENRTQTKHMSSQKMTELVDMYTRDFFHLTHLFVARDKAQPPRTLEHKMKKLEELREEGFSVYPIRSDLTDSESALSPREKIRLAQQKQIQQMHGVAEDMDTAPINDVEDAKPPAVEKSTRDPCEFGDPNTTPIVFVDRNNINQILLQVDQFGCAHTVRIVENILKGCFEGRSRISGLLDAVAVQEFSFVLIKIDNLKNAKRIAFQSVQNLSLLGFNTCPHEMNLTADTMLHRDALEDAFVRFSQNFPELYFDWKEPCNCPNNGVWYLDCPRHRQMNDRLRIALTLQELRLREFVKAGNNFLMDAEQMRNPPPPPPREYNVLPAMGPQAYFPPYYHYQAEQEEKETAYAYPIVRMPPSSQQGNNDEGMETQYSFRSQEKRQQLPENREGELEQEEEPIEPFPFDYSKVTNQVVSLPESSMLREFRTEENNFDEEDGGSESELSIAELGDSAEQPDGQGQLAGLPAQQRAESSELLPETFDPFPD